jgi:hypothetical protein
VTYPIIDYQVRGRDVIVRMDDPLGWRVLTYTFFDDPDDDDVQQALASAITNASREMSVGEKSWTRRTRTPLGQVYTHLMLGPPTWWKPRYDWQPRPGEPGWQVMVGWLRAGVALAWRPNRRSPSADPFPAWVANQLLTAAGRFRGGRTS